MAHPHITSLVFFFSLNASQHRRYAAFASGRVSWVEALAVVAVSDIDPLVSSDWVRINNWRWMNAVFPLLLHLCMHDQERIVWQMDGNLPFGVCSLVLRACVLFIVSGDDFAHSKFSGNPKTQAADDGTWPKVGELIGVIAYAFGTSFVAVNKSCIGYPFLW